MATGNVRVRLSADCAPSLTFFVLHGVWIALSAAGLAYAFEIVRRR